MAYVSYEGTVTRQGGKTRKGMTQVGADSPGKVERP
jgi:hypothetical protein